MAASLKGLVISYFIDVARGNKVTLHTLCKAVGKNYDNPTERQQVLHAIANVMRDRRDGLDRAPIDIQNIVPAAVWYQADYVAPAPEVGVPEPVSAPPTVRERISPEPDPFPKPISWAGEQAERVVFEHLGPNRDGAPVLRDPEGKLWVATPL